MYGRSTGSPAFLVPQRRESIGKPVDPITGPHTRTVPRTLGKSRTPGCDQACQHWSRLTLPYGNYPRDEPSVLGHIDRLAVPYPRQYLAGVMPQVP